MWCDHLNHRQRRRPPVPVVRRGSVDHLNDLDGTNRDHQINGQVVLDERAAGVFDLYLFLYVRALTSPALTKFFTRRPVLGRAVAVVRTSMRQPALVSYATSVHLRPSGTLTETVWLLER